MTNIPNIFYWHSPNKSCSRDKRHFYTPWTEQAFCIFSLLNSLSRINIYWHLGALDINNTTMWPCQPFLRLLMAVSLNDPVESSCLPSTIHSIYLITVFLHLLQGSLIHRQPWVSCPFHPFAIRQDKLHHIPR